MAVRGESQIYWYCAACAELESSELDPVVPDSPPLSSPQPASPTPTSPAAPSTPSSPLPASPTTASPIAVELSLEDPDPAQLEIQQRHQLTFNVVDDATLKKKAKARRQRWIHLQCEETVCRRDALAVHGATEGKYYFSRKGTESNLRFC